MKKPIKILYAPYNIASMPAITIDALNKIEGVIARGVAIDNNQYLDFGVNKKQNWNIHVVDSNVKKPWLYIINLFLAELSLIKRILWADIIIWQWDIKIYMPHYWLIKLSKKPIIVEWLGSDIRIPEIVFEHNPYFQEAFKNNTYTYKKESKARSYWIQYKFKYLKAIPYLCPEMTLFLNRKLFPNYYSTFQRINLNNYIPNYPKLDNLSQLKIIHSPSSTGAKGTEYVRSAITKLKRKYNFEYVEITNKSHKEALNSIRTADLF
ncbi:MAG: hypothetical protein IPO85_04350 [Saprospiraceae bacterium]|uniref:Glycosyltransferase n=1 Tax=Candidatus Defluviibacterium haderslevense TaxID=2981993 RepID=A0A9D7XDN5_9BACT|nr:hypothetical protein [Candidatus Defluviibacterium haderslevense]